MRTLGSNGTGAVTVGSDGMGVAVGSGSGDGLGLESGGTEMVLGGPLRRVLGGGDADRALLEPRSEEEGLEVFCLSPCLFLGALGGCPPFPSGAVVEGWFRTLS